MSDTPWMIYGAYGYTGALISAEAARRGLRPYLAGRREEAVRSLAERLNLPWRVFSLEDANAVRRNLEDMTLVLHCAGPFSQTSAPMVAACLETSTHYLDITGEIAVFEAVHRQDEIARNRGVLLLPGCGFDVVPTDCLALALKKRLPDATHLLLAFTASGRPSPGTARTMVEGLKFGGRIRKDGKLVRVPLAYRVQDIPFLTGTRRAVTIPWGDVATAFYTTGIPNIEVYTSMTDEQLKQLRKLRWLRPLLGLSVLQNSLAQTMGRRPGPTEEERRSSRVAVYGRVHNTSGEQVEGHILTPNGYDVTVHAALAIVQRLLEGAPETGARTPAGLFGETLIEAVPGVEVHLP